MSDTDKTVTCPCCNGQERHGTGRAGSIQRVCESCKAEDRAAWTAFAAAALVRNEPGVAETKANELNALRRKKLKWPE